MAYTKVFAKVRGTSDALCRENELSVIVPQGHGKHYAEQKGIFHGN